MMSFYNRTRQGRQSASRRKRPPTARRRHLLEPLEPRRVLDSTVVFNEIMYNPDGPDAELEWIELHNQMSINMDISRWSLRGGVDFEFEEGTIVPGRGYVVIAAQPDELESATGYSTAIGPWTGTLSDAGEELRLLDNDGRRMSTVDYNDKTPWPVGPDGAGVTLAKHNQKTRSDNVENWTMSAQITGTPGADNFPAETQAPTPPLQTKISAGDAVRVLVPTQSSQLSAHWNQAGFNDQADPHWFDRTLGIGYDTDGATAIAPKIHANGDLQTTMAGVNASSFSRTQFSIADPAHLQEMQLAVDYNNGFVAYINGTEVARRNAPDGLLSFDSTAAAPLVGYASFVQTLNPSAYYRLNETTVGTVTDSSGQGHHAVHFPGFSATELNQTPGALDPHEADAAIHANGGRVDLSGVESTALVSGKQDFSVSLWANPDNFSKHDYGTLFFMGKAAGGKGLILAEDGLSAAGHIRTGQYGNDFGPVSGHSNKPMNLGQWNHIGATFDASSDTFKLYINGELDFSTTVALNIGSGGSNLGQLTSSGGQPFAGDLDEFAFFQTVLSEEEMFALADTTVGGTGDPNSFDSHTLDLTSHLDTLVSGANVLAIQGLNEDKNDANFLLNPTLSLRPNADAFEAGGAVVINEVSSALADVFYVELANPSSASIDLSGYTLQATGSEGGEFTFTTQSIPVGEFLAFTESELGFSARDGEKLFLYGPQKLSVADAQRVTSRLRGRSEAHDGQWLFPTSETPAAANQFNIEDDMVINEIMYHQRPRFDTTGGTGPTLTSELLIGDNSPARVLVPTQAWQLDSNWNQLGFDDQAAAQWFDRENGIGFDTGGQSSVTTRIDSSGNIQTEMSDINASAFVRFPFDVDNPNALQGLSLDVDYNDGFVAYLNGQEVGRHNAESGDLSYNASAEIVTGQSYDSRVKGLEPSLYYRLDETTYGTVTDDSGNNRHASHESHATVNQPGIQPGNTALNTDGRAVDLNGVQGSGMITGNKDFSVSIWVRPDDFGTSDWGTYFFMGAASSGKGLILNESGVGNGHVVPGVVGANFGESTNSLTLGQWNHVGFTYDASSTTAKLFLNGNLETTTIISNVRPGGVSSLNIGTGGSSLGSYGANNGQPFNGGIDEFAFFKNVLSDAEMLSLSDLDSTTNDLSNSFGELTLNLTANIPSLVPGTNLLAFHGLNSDKHDDDFLLHAKLLGYEQEVVSGQTYAKSNKEWIELYNRNSTQPIDLTGWSLAGSIDYDFSAGTTIGPNDYLVVANAPDTLSGQFPGIDVHGPFSGRLGDNDGTIILKDNHKNPANQVHYYDSGRWPEYADGGGASLELRDPAADNSVAEAWAASDESSRASWNTYTYRQIAQSDTGPTTFHELVLGLLDSGEFLIDDVSVRRAPDGANAELIQNGTFDSDAIGGPASKWRVIGRHQGTVIDDPDTAGNNRVLQITSSGNTRHQHDHAETTLTSNITNGTEYQISFRAKWLVGSPLLNTRLYFTRVAKTIVLAQPNLSGTPGSANTQQENNIGPTYRHFIHQPIVPGVSQQVTVTVEADDPQGVTSMKLWWSVNEGTWNSATMSEIAGSYSATIPGQSAGSIVQFYVQGQDGAARTSTFPARGRDSRALFRVDNGRGGNTLIDDIHLIMLSSDANTMLLPTEALSNLFYGATVAVNNEEVFYDVGARQKGSVFGRTGEQTGVSRSFRVNFHPDRLFRDAHDKISLDASGRSGITGDQQDEIINKQLLNHAGGIASWYDDLAYMIGPLSATGPIILQQARYDNLYLRESLPNGTDGMLYEFEGIGTPNRTQNGHPESLKIINSFVWLPQDIANLGDSKEDYRWRFEIKNNRDRDDYSRIIEMAKAYSLTGSALEEAIFEIMDVDQQMRTFAMMSLQGVYDIYTVLSTQNLAFYVHPETNKVLMFPWDWDQSWWNPTSAPLHGTAHANMTKIFNIPRVERLHLGHLHDLIQTTFNTTYMAQWTSHFGSLVGQGYSGNRNYIKNRGNYVLSRLPSEVPFTISTSDPHNAGAATMATIQGTGWINVRNIRLSGNDQPLDVFWSVGGGSSFANTWQVKIPVSAGTDSFTLEAYDYQDALIASDTVQVTSTTPNPVSDGLRISELNYNPSDPTTTELATLGNLDNDDFEFIEVTNISGQTINLLGTRFINGVDFVFPNLQLSPGERGVVVQNRDAFELRYGASINVLGQFASGRLSNGGENLTLVDSQSQNILDFSYGDSDPWPIRADGHGATIEVIDPAGTPLAEYGKYYHWRGSTEFAGSPASAGQGPLGVVINEVLAHTDPPVTQSDSIELINTTNSPINISGWYLSDSANNLFKYQIPVSPLLGPGQYRVFDEDDFNPTPLSPSSHHFALSGAQGDQVWLVKPNSAGGIGSFIDDVHFRASLNGESFGRLPDGSGRLAPMTQVTLGSANDDARVGPLVISGLNYNPGAPSAAALAIDPTFTSADLEFLQIQNPTGTSVDLTNWRIRGGVDYDFAAGTVLDAGEKLVILSFNPESTGNVQRLNAFRTHYGIDNHVQLTGGYANQLSNSFELVILQRPDTPPLDNPTVIPHTEEDAVLYDDLAPWPTSADGTGEILHRVELDRWGSYAASWTAKEPQLATSHLLGDTDRDGDVDTLDLTTAIVNFTSAGGSGKTWSQGDTDGDGDVDTSDLTTAIINFTGAKTSVMASVATSNTSLPVPTTREIRTSLTQHPAVDLLQLTENSESSNLPATFLQDSSTVIDNSSSSHSTRLHTRVEPRLVETLDDVFGQLGDR